MNPCAHSRPVHDVQVRPAEALRQAGDDGAAAGCAPVTAGGSRPGQPSKSRSANSSTAAKPGCFPGAAGRDARLSRACLASATGHHPHHACPEDSASRDSRHDRWRVVYNAGGPSVPTGRRRPQVRPEISQYLELARAELLPFDPETSAVRMRWARATVAVLDGQSAPRIRPIAAADRSALATNPAAGLSAIRSA